MGSYKNPRICDEQNIMAVHKSLKKVEILCGDYSATSQHAGANSFFYFDPPYKPVSKTSNFNSYAKGEFNDDEQIRLSDFCLQLQKKGHKWMLSNSDVNGTQSMDSLFDDLYSDFNNTRVKAKRSINSNPGKRGELNELLITNYAYTSDLQPA
jgi:DNA adenine methylase